jgi:hypothetical protein
MKGFSFRQPWGWAITDVTPAAIAKRIENRVWRHLKSGKPPIPLHTDFAIHVSASKPGEWDVDGVMSALDVDYLPPEAVLASAFIGTAQIAMVLRCKEEQRNLSKTSFALLLEKGGPWEIDPQDQEKFLYDLKLPLSTEQRHEQLRRWWIGPHAFVLDSVKKLREPILGVKGALSFWDVQPAHVAQIQEQL